MLELNATLKTVGENVLLNYLEVSSETNRNLEVS